jgi:hypothetical protein
MKSLLLIGGMLGFAIGLLFSWAQDSSWPATLWRAAIAAYFTGIMMRWWGRAWRKNLEKALLERQSALSAAGVAKNLSSQTKS